MITLVDKEINDLDLEVKEGEKLEIRLASFTDFPSVKIHVKVQKNGIFDGAFADFSKGFYRIIVRCQFGDFGIGQSTVGHIEFCATIIRIALDIVVHRNILWKIVHGRCCAKDKRPR